MATWARILFLVLPVSFVVFAQPLAVADGSWWPCEAFYVVTKELMDAARRFQKFLTGSVDSGVDLSVHCHGHLVHGLWFFCDAEFLFNTVSHAGWFGFFRRQANVCYPGVFARVFHSPGS